MPESWSDRTRDRRDEDAFRSGATTAPDEKTEPLDPKSVIGLTGRRRYDTDRWPAGPVRRICVFFGSAAVMATSVRTSGAAEGF